MSSAIRHWVLGTGLFLGVAGFLAGLEAAFGHGAMHNPGRTEYLRAEGIPAEYEGLLNPLLATEEHLASGAELYDEYCSACHGADGDGLGEAAEGLEPPPAALKGMYAMVPMSGMGEGGPHTHLMHGVVHHHPGQTHAEAMGGLNIDAYMFWSMAEGGEAFDSAMPAFKELLDENESWQVLLFVANGFTATP